MRVCPAFGYSSRQVMTEGFVTDIRMVDQAKVNRQRAKKCRELAKMISKPAARSLLEELAGELEAKAVACEAAATPARAALHKAH